MQDRETLRSKERQVRIYFYAGVTGCTVLFFIGVSQGSGELATLQALVACGVSATLVRLYNIIVRGELVPDQSDQDSGRKAQEPCG